jgi:replicative DNA helicase
MKYSELLRARHREMVEQLAAVARGEDPRAIIPTGLRDFDKRAGTKRGMLTLYGAQTGEGKSIWKKHLMEAAARAGFEVDVYDFEDPPERTADRTFSTLTLLNNAKMQSLELSDKEMTRIGIALSDAEEWGDRINYHPGLRRAGEVIARIKESTADLVLVDYLQALPGEGEGLERTIAEFCWELNAYAQASGAAVVVFSQVTSEVEKRGLRMLEAAKRREPDGVPYVEGFRPFGASDLNWCSAAGHRAKELGFLFRPGRYLRRFGHNARDDVMEFSFPKANFGSEGVIRVGFDGKTARLFDLPEKT